MNKDLRDRLLRPAGVAVYALIFIGALVWSFSRVLLAVERDQAVAVAMVMAVAILGAASVIAARPRLKTSILGAVLFVTIAAIIGTGAIASTVVGELPAGEAEKLPKGPVAESPRPAPPPSNVVTVEDSFFQPKDLTVPVGTTVTWRQTGGLPHTVTAADGSFDSHPDCPADQTKCMASGDTFEHAFTQPGRIAYYCKIHGTAQGAGMAGTIVVRAGTGPGPGATTTASPAVAPKAARVSAVDSSFSPQRLQVTLGTAVVWTNTGALAHTVTADDGSFDSSSDCTATDTATCLAPRDTFQFVFRKAGTIPYYCKIHGAPGGVGMSGVIVVR